MGNMFSFFKKPKGTKEQLEDIENELDKIEEYRISALVRERNCNALLIVSTVITYITGLGYLYFDYNNSKSFAYKTVALCFIVFIPPIGYYAKNLVRIYYKWVKDTNMIKTIAFVKLKKKLLSKVQETETFNDAKMILERFDPGALRNMSMSLNNLSNIDTNRETTLNQRSRPPTAAQNTPKVSPPQFRAIQANPTVAGGNMVSFNTPVNFAPRTPRQPLGRTVKPILPQNRSVVEKVVDYMFADGPANRYALICGQCSSHNGMALADEFEYISYICAYCGGFNPARKARPNAPKIDLTKAIEAPKMEEAPKVEEVDDAEQGSTVKITEISSELNKTMDIQVQEKDKPTEKEEETHAEETNAEQASSSNEPDNKEPSNT